MTRPASARRRLVPPTLRDEPSDSACAEIAARGRGIGPTYPTRRTSAGSAAPTRRGLPGRRQFEVKDDLWLFAPSQSLRRLVRQGEVAHPQDSERTAAHVTHTQRKTPSPPSTRPCRSRALSRSTPWPRTRSASAGHQGARSGAYQAGWRGELAGGGARRYVQARVCSAPCRPRTAAVVAADGAAGVPCAFASWVRLARS